MRRPDAFRIPILGIILILVGAGLLLERLGTIHAGWDFIIACGLIAIGAGSTIKAFFYQEQGKIFFGTMSFLAGLLLLFTSLGLVLASWALYLPAALLILGISFSMIYVLDQREWGLLIPGGIFIMVGIFFMLAQLDMVHIHGLLRTIGVYWPVLLILIGGVLVLGRKRRETAQGAVPPDAPQREQAAE